MFARDSVHDLASLAKHAEAMEESEASKSGSEEEEHEEGDSSEVALARSGDSDPNLTSQDKQEEEADTKSAAASEVSTSNMTGVSSSTGQYSGFYPDSYGDYVNDVMTYSGDPYAPTVFGEKKRGNFICCLFAPWFQDKTIEAGDDESGASDKNSAGAEDDVSTGSDMYGDKLTDKDRLAVLARLRLSQPDPKPEEAPPATSAAPPKKGLLSDITSGSSDGLSNGDNGNTKTDPVGSASGPGKLKGILKRTKPKKVAEARTSSAGKGQPAKRRSLFPTLENQSSSLATQNHVRFSPMARVLSVKSRKDMTFMDKTSIWWQRSDYDSFKKAGRVIAKAILEGGSEVWLTSNPNTLSLPPNVHRTRSADSKPGQRSFHISDRGSDLHKYESGKPLPISTCEDKWWCKFGHSRRGLEHIASMEEGRQRQMNVRASTRAVLQELRRQRMTGKQDPEKVRSTYLRYNGWARDLSHAAALADEEAVKTQFGSDAKTREFYLLKQTRSTYGTGRQVPAFMLPNGVSPVQLDAQTSSQIRFRRKQVVPQPSAKAAKKEPSAKEKMEAIHDPMQAQERIAKKAVAFGTDEKDMAAVLSGMGAVSAERDMQVPQSVRAN